MKHVSKDSVETCFNSFVRRSREMKALSRTAIAIEAHEAASVQGQTMKLPFATITLLLIVGRSGIVVVVSAFLSPPPSRSVSLQRHHAGVVVSSHRTPKHRRWSHSPDTTTASGTNLPVQSNRGIYRIQTEDQYK